MLSLRPVVVRGGKARMTSQGEFMTFRFTPKTLFGATAMLVVGAALVSAQDTSKTKPRSDRRIPISKEAPGEVVRTDTVMIYRTDTLQLTQRVVDTVRMTRTRVDTVIPRSADVSRIRRASTAVSPVDSARRLVRSTRRTAPVVPVSCSSAGRTPSKRSAHAST